MSPWLLLPADRLSELAQINAQRTDRQCTAHLTTSGVWVTGSDKLGDGYWSDFAEFLGSLEEFVGVPEFAQPEEAP